MEEFFLAIKLPIVILLWSHIIIFFGYTITSLLGSVVSKLDISNNGS